MRGKGSADDMNIREKTESIEATVLSKNAALSIRTKGREKPEAKCDIRTEFQRDRDRIIHCNSFRRLKHKTQVFLSPLGDHYRTRLTHTLEVSQIARTIARALRLNEDLTEAIALGHDLGHTPFGHAGERALNEICPFGFEHAAQSVRVVSLLEKDGRGLNLTYEVKNGIACHTSGRAQTLEGRAVKLADKVAYINHDIEDAVRAGILTPNDLPYNCVYVLGRTKNERITTVINSVIENSGEDIAMSPQVEKAHTELKKFMFESLYTNEIAKGEEGKAESLVKTLFSYFLEHQDKLPDNYKKIDENMGAERAVCDYIAGMSDVYAVNLFKSLFIPNAWTL